MATDRAMCLTRHRDYDATPTAVSAARDFVSAFAVAMLSPHGWSVADDAGLVVSELVSSAVQAGCTHVDVLADLHADRLELVVTGHGANAPAASPAALHEAVGRHVPGWGELIHTPAGSLVGAARLACEDAWTAAVPCTERP